MGQSLMVKAPTTGFDWSKPVAAPPQPPGSIYLRMADGRVPSIYGPSGDEPWR